MSKTDIIALAFFSPFVIMLICLPLGLIVLFFQKVVPALWGRRPSWYLPRLSRR